MQVALEGNNEFTSLSLALRKSTAIQHQQTEDNVFIQRLFQGQLEADEYAIYLLSLKGVYTALEAGLEKLKDHPWVKPIFNPSLHRLEALQFDLNHWFSSRTGQTLPDCVAQASLFYQNRIESVAGSRPELIVAHSYVRRLGDLSGGQILKNRLRAKYPIEKAFRFYDFDGVRPAEAKARYRKGLDAIGASHGEIELFCREAQIAFELNGRLFRALEEAFS